MVNEPIFSVESDGLLPVLDYPSQMTPIPTSKMFVVKRALATYKAKYGQDAVVYDASQGDGGESLTGVPADILRQAAELQIAIGTAYDTPAGHPRFRKAAAENYWQLGVGWGPDNILAGQGGRDILMKAYSAMVHLGTGRVGDVIIASAVPWISYNWGPYVGGLNVLRAPGDPNDGWKYTPEGIKASVDLAASMGRQVGGIIITSPDNPTGRVMPISEQIAIAKTALDLGVKYVLFDWIYHWVTEGEPHNINDVLEAFTPEERNRLMFLDGLTKSLGGSNIRSCHLVASTDVVKFVTSHASHGVIPSFYSQAVAIVAYEMGYGEACRPIVAPTNASRRVLGDFLAAHDYTFVNGDGYYAFIDVERWIKAKGFEHSEGLGALLAEEFGIAVVPGVFFSPAGQDWIRFSYALPPERTAAAVQRLHEALQSFEK